MDHNGSIQSSGRSLCDATTEKAVAEKAAAAAAEKAAAVEIPIYQGGDALCTIPVEGVAENTGWRH
jgi:hypothetical protein